MPRSEAPPDTREPQRSRRTTTSTTGSSDTGSPTLSDYDYELNLVHSPTASDTEPVPGAVSPTTEYTAIRIPLEQNLQALLVKITDREDLESVTALRLRVIADDFSLQRVPVFVPHLTELSLEGSALVSLRDLGADMAQLTVLRVTRTGLNSLDGVGAFPRLLELHAGHNGIRHVVPCCRLPQLRLLDLKRNLISDVNALSFLELCPTLQHLVLAENPVAHVDSYRAILKQFLPDLVTLDNAPYHHPDSQPDAASVVRPNNTTRRLSSAHALKNAAEKPRPNTASGVECGIRERLQVLPARPATARRAKDSDFSDVADGSYLKLRDIRKLFVPSELTSGSPMCGNPAVALLQKRSAPAWTDN